MGSTLTRTNEIIEQYGCDQSNLIAIMQEIERGLTGRYILIENRTRAIAYAVESGEPGDTVIVCGKGGEQYQEVAGCRHPYSDREVVRRVLHLT